MKFPVSSTFVWRKKTSTSFNSSACNSFQNWLNTCGLNEGIGPTFFIVRFQKLPWMLRGCVRLNKFTPNSLNYLCEINDSNGLVAHSARPTTNQTTLSRVKRSQRSKLSIHHRVNLSPPGHTAPFLRKPGTVSFSQKSDKKFPRLPNRGRGWREEQRLLCITYRAGPGRISMAENVMY